MASMGICVGVLMHLDLESPQTLAIALAFTLLGAAIFAFTNKRASEVPQEAIIGISYVVAAAMAVLLLSRASEGDEEIKNMLVGNILLVTPGEIVRTAVLFGLVGLVHFVFRRRFLAVSFERETARAEGVRLRAWDFLFYALFGVVVTSFIRIVGVLLVFSYLIVPAVSAVLLARRVGMRLLAGCAIALVGGVGGLFASFYADLPSGAAIVCCLGALLVVIAVITGIRRRSAAASS